MKNKILILTGILFVVCRQNFAQSFAIQNPIGYTPAAFHYDEPENTVYDLDLKKELMIIAPSVALGITDLFIDYQSLTAEDLGSLDINSIPVFERNIVYFDSAYAAVANDLSNTFNKAALALGVVSVLSGYPSTDNIFINGILYIEGTMFTSGLVDVLKKSVGRVRPYAYNTDYSDGYRLRGAVTSSFPSGHSSSTAFNCFFAAKMIDDYFIDDDEVFYKSLDWTLAAAIPAWVAYLRMAAGVHFLTDVATGYLIGASCGFIIPELHKIDQENLSLFPVFDQQFTGIGMQLKF